MSELKEHIFCECDEMVYEYRGQLSNEMRPYYLKSEADRHIGELKDLNKALKHDALRDRDRIRHHKYKRCLAMAKKCDASMAYFGEFYDDASKRMVAHYYKWRGRWYELAEKFKEADK